MRPMSLFVALAILAAAAACGKSEAPGGAVRNPSRSGPAAKAPPPPSGETKVVTLTIDGMS